MYGFGYSGPPDPVVGEHWVQKSSNEKFLLDQKNPESNLYHLVGEGGYDRGWFQKDQILKYFAKWVDPNASLKAYAKKHGYVWKDEI